MLFAVVRVEEPVLDGHEGVVEAGLEHAVALTAGL
jgi:hypothetical protein